MTIHGLPPLFLANMQHKYFGCYPQLHKVKVVKLLYLDCLDNRQNTMLTSGQIYYGYEDMSSASWTYSEGYKVYKIFLPFLGARKYKPSRFNVLDTLILKKTDFHENSIKDTSLTYSKNKNEEQYREPSKEVHTGAFHGGLSLGVPYPNK